VKKYIANFVLSGYGILIIFAAVVSLSTWFYISYTSPKDIQYKYNGIKYQAGNLQSAEPINIEIKGKFKKELFDIYGEFNGAITVGEKIFTDSSIAFNKDKMGSIDTGKGQYGMIFIENMFEKLTIEIHEPDGNGGYRWNGINGWMISAPCSDRKEAVQVSNILLQKSHKGLKIK
jgi:hypothetical protein